MIGGGGRTRIAWPKATTRGRLREHEAETTSILQSEWEAKKRSIATL